MPEKNLSEIISEHEQIQANLNLMRRAGVPGFEKPPDPEKVYLQLFRNAAPVDANLFANQRTCILGMSGSGKTNSMAVLAEEFLKLKYSCLILDTEKDFTTLADSMAIKVFSSATANPSAIVQHTMLENQSAVLARDTGIRDFGNLIAEIAGLLLETGKELKDKGPAQDVKVFMDEAHNFVTKKQTALSDQFDLFARESRSNRMSFIMATQRPQDVRTSVISQATLWILHRFVHLRDQEAVASSWGKEEREKLAGLADGECFFFTDKEKRVADQRYFVRRRETRHKSQASTHAQIHRKENLEKLKKMAVSRRKGDRDGKTEKLDPDIPEKFRFYG